MIRGIFFVFILFVCTLSGYAQEIAVKQLKIAEKFAKKAEKAFAKKDYEKSAILYEDAIAVNPWVDEYYLMQGQSYQFARDDSAAMTAFTKAIKKLPNTTHCYFKRGILRYRMEDYRGAYSDYEAHSTIHGESIQLLDHKKIVLFKLEEFETAVSVLNQTISLDPNSSSALIDRAFCHLKSENLPAAEKDLMRAIQLNHQSFERYQVEGLFYLKKGEPRKSISAYQKILICSRRSVLAYDDFWYFSNAYHALGILDSAILQISTAIRHVEKPVYYLDRGNYYAESGDLEKAEIDYAKAIELDSSLTGAYNNRTFYIWFPKKEFQKAVDDLSKVIEIAPDNAFAFSNRSYAYYGLKDFEHAFIDAFKSVEMEDRNPYVYKNLALLYYAIDEKEEATNAAKGALNWGFPVDTDVEFQELLVNLGFSK